MKHKKKCAGLHFNVAVLARKWRTFERKKKNTGIAQNMDNCTEGSVSLFNRRSKSKQLTPLERQAILQYLLQYREGQKLKQGTIKKAALFFKVSRLTIAKIWNIAKKEYEGGKLYADVSSQKKKCGRKCKDYSAKLSQISNIPFNRRGTIRSLSFASGIPKSTLFDIFKKGSVLKRISSTIKPYLTIENQKARLVYCLSHVRPNGQFEDMFDHVHIDEKWFYLTQVKRTYYLMLDEEEPQRSCKSKRFITKVMFMCAVARPCFDRGRNQFFNGKLGIWPFVYKEHATRNSKNRPKGTLVTKVREHIDAAEYKKMIDDNVLPAIKSKLPRSHKKRIVYIQQDNAKPHSYRNGEHVPQAGDGWSIEFKSQPPNSPDLNVLDLGFFNSIQSLQHQASPTTIDELIECVTDAYNQISKETLNSVFLTLQKCMECIMSVNGSNTYKIPHIGKDALVRKNALPTSLMCAPDIIQNAKRQ